MEIDDLREALYRISKGMLPTTSDIAGLHAAFDELGELRAEKQQWQTREEQLVRIADKETDRANGLKQQLADAQTIINTTVDIVVDLYDQLEASDKQLTELQEENKRLREELAFYSDTANHQRPLLHTREITPVALDGGQRARKALGHE